MIINEGTLRTLNSSFNAAYNSAFGAVEPDWQKIATKAPSSTLVSEYGWLGMLPNVREWLGDRTIQGLTAHRYEIRNRDFELTVGVKRNDIEDDNLGIYAPLFAEMGRNTAEFPNQLVMGLLTGGFSTLCYDGQYFFDVDHPVLNANGVVTSVANTDATPGNGPAWFLLDTSRPLRPIIYQERRPFSFVTKDKPTDDNVFFKKEFYYGADARMNVGYGFWQMAWGSTQPLDDVHYSAARAGLQGIRGDFDHRLGIKPTTLIVPPSLEKAARQLIKADRDPFGASNVWVDSADLIISPWL